MVDSNSCTGTVLHFAVDDAKTSSVSGLDRFFTSAG